MKTKLLTLRTDTYSLIEVLNSLPPNLVVVLYIVPNSPEEQANNPTVKVRTSILDLILVLLIGGISEAIFGILKTSDVFIM